MRIGYDRMRRDIKRAEVEQAKADATQAAKPRRKGPGSSLWPLRSNGRQVPPLRASWVDQQINTLARAPGNRPHWAGHAFAGAQSQKVRITPTSPSTPETLECQEIPCAGSISRGMTASPISWGITV